MAGCALARSVQLVVLEFSRHEWGVRIMSITRRHFFDIPIYRCDIEIHKAEMKKKREKYLAYYRKPSSRASEADLIAFGNEWDKHSWMSWHYNEIIGWIDLYVRSDEIMGDLWEAEGKRPRARSKRVFRCQGDWFKLKPQKESSSPDIFQQLLARLHEIEKKDYFKGRFFDFAALNEIGPHVDWRALLNPK